jgi:hypothetical protein
MGFLGWALPHGADWVWVACLVVPWGWALFDCALREKERDMRLAWLTALLLGQVIGLLLYVVVRRPRRIRRLGR